MKKLLLIWLLLPFCLLAQNVSGIDSVFKKLNSYGNLNSQNIGKVFNEFDWGNTSQKIKNFNRLIYLAAKNGKKYLHAYSLYDLSWVEDFQKQKKLLSTAYSEAKHEKYFDLLGLIDMARGMDFKQASHLDSAMIYSLRARTELTKVGDKNSLINVLNTIADLHFDAGQYDEAEKLYRKILKEKGDPGGWKGWRRVVITNDLGLIRIQQGKYAEAEKYFLNSLHYKLVSTNNHLGYSDSVQIEYIYRKLFELNVLSGSKVKAEKYYNLSLALAKKFNFPAEIASIMAYKGSLEFSNKNYSSALKSYKIAEINNYKSPLVTNEVRIYLGLANTYLSLNDYKNEAKYLRKYETAQSNYDSTFYRSKYMNFYAEYNYKNYITEITHSDKIQKLLSLILLVTLLSLFVISYYFIKLKRSKQRLVAKNIELAVNEPYEVTHNIDKNEKGLSSDEESFHPEINILANKNETIAQIKSKELDDQIINEIIGKLEDMVSNRKVYLNPHITITELAEDIGTNRTYLSKAIAKKYSTNFINYINELRIKEAVRLIHAGEHLNLNMDGIAEKAGFNNRVSFSKAFSRFTGVSPSFFIKNLRE